MTKEKTPEQKAVARLKKIIDLLERARAEAVAARDEQKAQIRRDWSWIGTFEHAREEIAQIISSDGGEAGLEPLFQKWKKKLRFYS